MSLRTGIRTMSIGLTTSPFAPAIPIAQTERKTCRLGRLYQLPVLGIDAQGSAGSRVPSCKSSNEMPSGERTNDIWTSRGGRLVGKHGRESGRERGWSVG